MVRWPGRYIRAPVQLSVRLANSALDDSGSGSREKTARLCPLLSLAPSNRPPPTAVRPTFASLSPSFPLSLSLPASLSIRLYPWPQRSHVSLRSTLSSSRAPSFPSFTLLLGNFSSLQRTTEAPRRRRRRFRIQLHAHAHVHLAPPCTYRNDASTRACPPPRSRADTNTLLVRQTTRGCCTHRRARGGTLRTVVGYRRGIRKFLAHQEILRCRLAGYRRG